MVKSGKDENYEKENKHIKLINKQKKAISDINKNCLEDELSSKKHKLSELKLSYKRIEFLSTCLTVFIAIITVFNVISNSNNNSNEFIKLRELEIAHNNLKYKGNDSKLIEENSKVLDEINSEVLISDSKMIDWVEFITKEFGVLLLLIVIIYFGLHQTAKEISENESVILLLEKQIKYNSHTYELLSEKDIDIKDNLENAFNEKLLLYKGQLSKEEKVKKLKLLQIKLEDKKRNIIEMESNRPNMLYLFSCVSAMYSIFMMITFTWEKLIGESGNKFTINVFSLTMVNLIAVLAIGVQIIKNMEYNKKKNAEYRENNKKQNELIGKINIEIEVLKYLLYFEDIVIIEKA